jgi:deoxyhypusine synthase
MISDFINNYFWHYNARELKEAAIELDKHFKKGGTIFVTLAGAMSTARLGKILVPMIEKGLISGISTTGANLEEDVFNIFGRSKYKYIPKYYERDAKDDALLWKKGWSRVTDTAINEDSMIFIWEYFLAIAQSLNAQNIKAFPHEIIWEIFDCNSVINRAVLPLNESWVYACKKKNIPIFVPGWEDSTLGNAFTADVIRNDVNLNCLKTGIEYMIELQSWYKKQKNLGFFQIGGGIAGDFPICVVPMILKDLEEKCSPWTYFCQISDAVESYGGYSGAPPSEKISWGKLTTKTPRFKIQSDATIVAPLIFCYVLEQYEKRKKRKSLVYKNV